MKTKTYKYGNWNLKAYFKAVGEGYEVGFHWDGKPLFVGNFVHAKEATRWWGTLNQEIKKFTKKYWSSSETSAVFYKKFFANHLYKTYYTFLDKWFAKYNTTYKIAFKRYEKQYKRLARKWEPTRKNNIKHAS